MKKPKKKPPKRKPKKKGDAYDTWKKMVQNSTGDLRAGKSGFGAGTVGTV